MVDAGGVVNAFMLHAVINISLATISFVARSAMTTNKNRDIKTFIIAFLHKKNIYEKIPESSFFQNFTSGAIAARVAVARIDGGLAELSVIAGSAEALVITFGCRPACSSVLARESVAGITLGEHFIRYFT